MTTTLLRYAALFAALATPAGCTPTGSTDDTDPSQDDTDATQEPADTWDNFAGEFMVTYCVDCHSSGSKDFNTYDDVVANAEKTRCGTASSTLSDCSGWPPAGQFPAGGGAMPSDDERDRLIAWIDAGTPE